jgi:hypothetical protein
MRWSTLLSASPIDYLQLPIQTLKVGSLGTHKALGLAKAKRARFLLRQRPKYMEIRQNTRSERNIGDT